MGFVWLRAPCRQPVQDQEESLKQDRPEEIHMADSPALNSTALITGAASGIGRALVAAFGQAGYRTIGVDRAPAEGVETLDVTDDAAVTAFAANLDGLAVLINAAGVIRLQRSTTHRSSCASSTST